MSVRRAASVFIRGAAVLFRCAAGLFVRRAATVHSSSSCWSVHSFELLWECSFVELKGVHPPSFSSVHP